jgi:integrase
MSTYPPPTPDPFTIEDRDRILSWFQERRPFYLHFVLTLFHTGMRPSEAVALRWSDVDASGGSIRISRSSYLGAEGATKTAGSERTIRLLPAVRDALRQLQPLHVEPSDHVFTNAKNGGPIDEREWPKDHWRAALRATGVRARKFYATRHTFISVGLTRGMNLKFLAEYCGASVAIIERDYGRFLASEIESQLQLLAEPANTREQRRTAVRHPKASTARAGLTVRAEKPLWSKASPTGFEHVPSDGAEVVEKASGPRVSTVRVGPRTPGRGP